jgi:hypothetical protein
MSAPREATRADLIRQLEGSNRLLQMMMRSDAPFDWRNQAYEQLQSNMRWMGIDEAVIAAIPGPAQTYVAPVPAPWRPEPTGRYLTDAEVLMPPPVV